MAKITKLSHHHLSIAQQVQALISASEVHYLCLYSLETEGNKPAYHISRVEINHGLNQHAKNFQF